MDSTVETQQPVATSQAETAGAADLQMTSKDNLQAASSSQSPTHEKPKREKKGGFLSGLVRRVAGLVVNRSAPTASSPAFLAEQLLAAPPGARRPPSAEEAAEYLGNRAAALHGAQRTRALRMWAATLTEIRLTHEAAETGATESEQGDEAGWSTLQLNHSGERPRASPVGDRSAPSPAEASQAKFICR